MTKSELIETILSRQSQLSAKDVELAVKTIIEHMSQALANGERIEIRATARRSRAHLRRGIGGEQAGKLARVRRQFRDAEHPLRGVGMLVQRRTKETLDDHGDRAP